MESAPITRECDTLQIMTTMVRTLAQAIGVMETMLFRGMSTDLCAFPMGDGYAIIVKRQWQVN